MSTVVKKDYTVTKDDLSARWKVTTKTIENWEKKGTIPKAHRFSIKCVRWSMTDILAYERKLAR